MLVAGGTPTKAQDGPIIIEPEGGEPKRDDAAEDAIVPELDLGLKRRGAEGNRRSPDQIAPGLRKYTWSWDLGLMQVVTALNITTTIRLDPDEVIVQAAIGDTRGWDFVLTSENTVSLQPRYAGNNTNVKILTESDREYLFSVTAVGYTHPYQPDSTVEVVLRDDGELRGSAQNAHVSARETAPGSGRTETSDGRGPAGSDPISGMVSSYWDRTGTPRAWDDPWNPDYNGVNTLAEIMAESSRGPRPHEFFGNLQVAPSDPSRITWLGYTMRLSSERARSIQPEAIWNDGTHTILRFSPYSQQTPAILHLVDGVERPVNVTAIGATGRVVQVDVVGDLVLRLSTAIVCVDYDDPRTQAYGNLAAQKRDRPVWTPDFEGNAELLRPTRQRRIEHRTTGGGAQTWEPPLETPSYRYEGLHLRTPPATIEGRESPPNQWNEQFQPNTADATSGDYRAAESDSAWSVHITGRRWREGIPAAWATRAEVTTQGGRISGLTLDLAQQLCEYATLASAHCDIR